MSEDAPRAASKLDWMAALRFVFDDPRWFEKLGMGAVIVMVPILNIAVTGYSVTLIRQVADDHGRPLPEWRDLSALWWTGLPLAAAMWIYSAPIWFVLGTGAAFTVVAIAVTEAGGEPLVALGAVGLVAMLGLLFISVYGLAMSVVRPTVTLHYAREGTFGSCFELSEMLASVRRQFNGYASLYVVLFIGRSLLGMVLSPVMSALSAIPMIGQLLTIALAALAYLWLGLAGAHLEGQILRGAEGLLPGVGGTAADGPRRGPDRSSPGSTCELDSTLAGTTPAPSRA